MIPYGNHKVDQDDIDAVVDVLKNQFLTQGQQVPKFEKALAQYCQASFCLAVNSGTSALHTACLALGLSQGDWLWTSPITFVASANCALYCGASVDFVDIDPATRNISITALEQKLIQAEKLSRLPKVLVAVHYAGLPCDMQAIDTLARRYGFAVIEDASHALGSFYQDKPVGHGHYSDFTVVSFHPVKPITTAEGGALLTNNQALYQKALLFAKHGVTRDSELMENEYRDERDGDWYYQQVELGYNYRLSDMQAALGISQLKKLDVFITKRRTLFERYQQALAELALTLPQEFSYSRTGWHIYVIEFQTVERKTAFNQLRELGIGVNVHYIPVHLQPFYRKLGFKSGDFANAEAFYQNAITLPLYPELSFEQQDVVIKAVTQVCMSGPAAN